jgi:hypothetical protein
MEEGGTIITATHVVRGNALMLRLLSGFAAVTLLLAAAVPVSATDLDVDYGPIPVPEPVYGPAPPRTGGAGYDYMLRSPFHKMVPVREAPTVKARVVYALPSGIIPPLTGRCTLNLGLDEIAEKSAWYRWKLVAKRWCEVAGSNPALPGWIQGGFIRPF